MGEAEAEVVGAGEVLRDGLTLEEREQGALGVAEDQQVLVVVDAFGEAEVLAVRTRRTAPVADGERDVVEGHGLAQGRCAASTPAAASAVRSWGRGRGPPPARRKEPLGSKRGRRTMATRTRKSTPNPATTYAVRGVATSR